jgi:tetratricopeptide (TPR) repeat protein
MRLGALYILGLIEAGMGIPDAGARVRELEPEPGHRVNAQRVHLSTQLMQGNAEEAAAAQRRAELMMVQDGQQQRYPNSTARIEMYAYALADDLQGMKQVTERTAKLAELFPHWNVLVYIGRCHHRRMHGDFAGALEALEPALELAAPLRHREWAWLAATHIGALTGAGRAEEALALGREHLALCIRESLDPGKRDVARATAEAMIALGRIDEAVALLDGLIEEMRASGARGLPLGAVYETRAHAAIARGDADEFRSFADLCAAEYRTDRNPALAQKYERLLHAAKQREIAPPPRSQRAPAEVSRSVVVDEVGRRLANCKSGDERARCVLAILIEALQPDQAFLYGLHEGEMTLLCAAPAAPQLASLTAAVRRYVEREVEFEDMTALAGTHVVPTLPLTSSDAGDASLLQTQGTLLATDGSGRAFHPLLLATQREGQAMIAAVAALRFPSDRRHVPPPGLLAALAAALVDHDDVDAVTCIG